MFLVYFEGEGSCIAAPVPIFLLGAICVDFVVVWVVGSYMFQGSQFE